MIILDLKNIIHTRKIYTKIEGDFMQNLTQDIENYILSLLEENDEENFISLRRKELAKLFECVPSQINYVLRSRFTPAQGFLVESRRGGNGYIRIVRISCESPEEKLEHIDEIIGSRISDHDAHKLLEALQNRELVTMRERLLIEIALRHADDIGRYDYELTQYGREKMKADILKDMLKGLMLA